MFFSKFVIGNANKLYPVMPLPTRMLESFEAISSLGRNRGTFRSFNHVTRELGHFACRVKVLGGIGWLAMAHKPSTR